MVGVKIRKDADTWRIKDINVGMTGADKFNLDENWG